MYIVIISALVEWRVVKKYFNDSITYNSPYGEFIKLKFNGLNDAETIFMHGGYGKVNAAGSTQYAIATFKPDLIINIGTCGGFEGKVTTGDIILAHKTVIYDIYEQMFDSNYVIREFTTSLDLSWIKKPTPIKIIKSILVSADQDITPVKISMLTSKYNAIAGDWESGSIAHICKLNKIPCLILRGVSDLINESEGEAYSNPKIFIRRTQVIMKTLLDSIDQWILMFNNN